MAIYPSQYSFTQPVRYFKANDPYYYEVDNLPVRQLEENILWLKDQYAAFLGTGATGTELGFLRAGDDIDLEWIKQFRPKHVNGRTIKVQSGRYIGRVNDARREESSNFTEAYTAHNTTNNFVLGLGSARTGELQYNIWQNFTTALGASEGTLGTNCGLETAFTFYLQDLDGGGLGETIDPTTGLPQYAAQSTNTGIIGEQAQAQSMPIQWHGNFPIYAGDDGAVDFSLDNWANLNRRHLELVRKWKGVYRTAVMDYKEEEIDIPSFSDFDYYKVDPVNQQAVSLADIASQRLDLMVVYGHPVDASSSDLMAGFSNTAPLTITNPKLGIIRGAGIGVKNTSNGVPPVAGSELLNTAIDLDSGQNDIGSPKILANPNAERGDSNTGITLADGTVVNGSFPSPDDLGNLAASIAYNLQGDLSFQLVGQCVLPICYVLVEKNVSTLSQEKIIDIRPFLRSTEFTYNERAGVAAANPPLSMGNPAVGQAQLENVYNKLTTELAQTTTIPFTQALVGIKAEVPYIYSGFAQGHATTTYYGLPESGYPRGTGDRVVDGCRMNDVISLNNTMVAVGAGIVNHSLNIDSIGSDVDGFQKYITVGSDTRHINPLFDSARPFNIASHHAGEHQDMNTGIAMLNLDLGTYQAVTVEQTEVNLMDDFFVTAQAFAAGGWGDEEEDAEFFIRCRGWSVVERFPGGGANPKHYLTVRYDTYADDPDKPFNGAAGSITLARKLLTL